MRLALYHPEIPQNTGTLMRLCACMGMSCADIVHPTGFVWDDRRLRRAGLDYADIAAVHHHTSWGAFYTWSKNEKRRLILLDTKAEIPYTDFSFQNNDILMVGQEKPPVFQKIFSRKFLTVYAFPWPLLAGL